MLGISASYLGLGTSLPLYKLATNDDAPVSSRALDQVQVQTLTSTDGLLLGKQQARENSLLSAVGHRTAIDHSNDAPGASATASANVFKAEPWYVFDLPMPGHLCASVCSATPLSTIFAFGWSKRNDS